MDADRTAERDFVVRTAQENDVKFIRLWFTDILGHLKGFAITVKIRKTPSNKAWDLTGRL